MAPCVRIAGAVPLLFILIGCSRDDGLHRVVVMGKVSLDGEPIEDGLIRFTPLAGTPGPLSTSPIRSGNYICDQHGGVPSGRHRVEILAWDPTAEPSQAPGGPARRQLVPAKYNRESTIELSLDSSIPCRVENYVLP